MTSETPITLDDETTAQVMQLLRAGSKIEAIKLVREKSGSDLKEAKDFVENMISKHDQGVPDMQKIGKSGCLVFILIGIGFIAAAIHVIPFS